MLSYSTKSVDVLTTYKNTKKDKQKYCRNNCNFQTMLGVLFYQNQNVASCLAQKACFASNLLQTKKKFINVLRKLDTV